MKSRGLQIVIEYTSTLLNCLVFKGLDLFISLQWLLTYSKDRISSQR